jgi:hypothetical protein
MSAFQVYYERVHLGLGALPPLPHPATLPPAWLEASAWFRRYPEVAPPAADLPKPRQPRVSHAPLRSLKRDILAQLADYQVYAERLRRWDPESYKLFRRIGMYVPPIGMEASPQTLEPAIVRTLPGFGAIAIGLAHENEHKDSIPARFMYFRKLSRPGSDIERRGGGVVYRCHVYWDDAKDQKLVKARGYGVGLDFAVHVAPDGTLHALRMLQSAPQTIRHKRGAGKARKGANHSTVVHQRWMLPEVENARTKNAADAVLFNFNLMMNFWAQAAQASIIRVTATKSGLVMPFVVDVLQTPQFFNDREPVIIDGKKRRIFHIVRTHTRMTKRGPLHIKTHFAGLRQFKWNGYDIAITVPGREHKDLAEMDIGSYEDGTDEEISTGKFIEQNEFAEIIADAIGAPAVPA